MTKKESLPDRRTILTVKVHGPAFILKTGEFTGHWWIPGTKASNAELWCFLWSAPEKNGWVNNREAGDLRCYHTIWRHCNGPWTLVFLSWAYHRKVMEFIWYVSSNLLPNVILVKFVISSILQIWGLIIHPMKIHQSVTSITFQCNHIFVFRNTKDMSAASKI